MAPESVHPEDLLDRIRAEYREMPGLRLTVGQAARLWGLGSTTCERLLEVLVRTGFLFRAQDGAFICLDNVLRR